MTRKLLLILLLFFPVAASSAPPQQAQETSPEAALTSALVAACRLNEAPFSRYLTEENRTAFLGLPPAQRREFMKRMVLLAEPGRPRTDLDTEGRTVLTCEGDTSSITLRIGPARTGENLAFVRLLAAEQRSVDIGMVREGGGWRILSVGLLLVDIAELARQWREAEIAAREQAAIAALQRLREAVLAFRQSYRRLPERLEQLGPATEAANTPQAAGLVDAELASGRAAGYSFRYRILPGAEPGFELAAAPLAYGPGGRRSFYLDAAGVLRGADKRGAIATADDPRLDPDEGRSPR